MTKTERIEALEYENGVILDGMLKLENRIIDLEKEVKALKENRTVFYYAATPTTKYQELKTDLDKKKIELAEMVIKNWISTDYEVRGPFSNYPFIHAVKLGLGLGEHKQFLKLYEELNKEHKEAARRK